MVNSIVQLLYRRLSTRCELSQIIELAQLAGLDFLIDYMKWALYSCLPFEIGSIQFGELISSFENANLATCGALIFVSLSLLLDSYCSVGRRRDIG